MGCGGFSNFKQQINGMKKDKIIYWVSTSCVILFVGLGSLADFAKIEPIKESFKHIGFPEYIIPFFGVAKLLGTLAILIPALKRLKEVAPHPV
jgi:DoxX-like family